MKNKENVYGFEIGEEVFCEEPRLHGLKLFVSGYGLCENQIALTLGKTPVLSRWCWGVDVFSVPVETVCPALHDNDIDVYAKEAAEELMHNVAETEEVLTESKPVDLDVLSEVSVIIERLVNCYAITLTQEEQDTLKKHIFDQLK